MMFKASLGYIVSQVHPELYSETLSLKTQEVRLAVGRESTHPPCAGPWV